MKKKGITWNSAAATITREREEENIGANIKMAKQNKKQNSCNVEREATVKKQKTAINKNLKANYN